MSDDAWIARAAERIHQRYGWLNGHEVLDSAAIIRKECPTDELRAENERLREALQPFSDLANRGPTGTRERPNEITVPRAWLERARAAAEKPDA